MSASEILSVDDTSVTIDHASGGRLSSLVVAGHELLVPRREDPMGWGAFPMIPWAGRVRNGRFTYRGEEIDLPRTLPPHAIHGTAYLRSWTAEGAGASTVEFGDDWPWRGRARQTVSLEADRLELTIAVDNHDERPMPVTAGWHPWFRRTVGGVDVIVELTAARMWRRDHTGIPDGALVRPTDGPWDDCFTDLDGPVTLRWPGVLQLTVESNCRHVVVYDEDQRGVCVEPQSAPPDAHNSGFDLVEIGPGSSWTIATTWRWGHEQRTEGPTSTTLRS